MPKYNRPDTTDIGTNPFTEVDQFIIPTRKYRAKDAYDSNGDPTVIELELIPYIKFFVPAEHRLKTNALPQKSKEMLLWIMYSVDNALDYICINKDRYMKEIGINSINTYKTAINELVKANYLNPTVAKDVYWLNPRYFFRGDRLKKYPQNKRTVYDYTKDESDSIKPELTETDHAKV